MLRIINTRYPLARVLLLPARVQGEEAPREIAAAIHYANRYQLADVLIVGRGGGSIEDLWAFNEEIVARAIYDSDIPVISAVGHEPDVTISDYVADLRAATPSNAAELVTPDQDALRQTLDGMSATMTTVLNRRINTAQQHLSLLAQCSGLQSPQSYFEQREITLNHLAKRLANGQDGILNRKMLRYTQLTAKLDALSPLKVLSRGYAMVQKQGGEVVRSVKQIHRHDVLSVSFSDGVVTANVDRIEEN
jgi:exodeoxyribonuclease VII large subunit